MKIGLIIDTIDFGYTGAGNYAYNLAKNLLEIDSENQYFLIHNEKSRMPEESKDIFNRGTELTIKPPFFLKNKRLIESLITKRKYPDVLKNMDLDVVHETRGDDSLAPPVKLTKCPFKLVITVYDAFYLSQKVRSLIPTQQGIKSLKVYMYGRIVSHHLKELLSSDEEFYLTTISNQTKDSLVDYFNIPPDQVKVIYEGVDHNVFRMKEIERPLIQAPFILYVGSTALRKNVHTLVKAFCRVRKEFSHKLVMVSNVDKSIDKLLRQLNLAKDVIIKSNITTISLVDLYNLADLFVLPSFYEGSGTTALEAMACGCPVVTSEIPSLTEAVGDAGMKIDPYRTDDLAQVMMRVLSSQELREEMRRKSLKRAKMFSWEKTAKETLDVYKKVSES